MVIYSFRAIIPFCILGASILCGFTFAFRVIFNLNLSDGGTSSDGGATDGTEKQMAIANSRCSGNDDYGDFSSFFHVLKILFQAATGNFEEKVRFPVQPGSDSHVGVYLGLSLDTHVHWRVEIAPLQRFHLHWRDCAAQSACRHPKRYIQQCPIHPDRRVGEMSGKDGGHSVRQNVPYCSLAQHPVSGRTNELINGLIHPSCAGNSIVAEESEIGHRNQSNQSQVAFADFIWMLEMSRGSFTIWFL